MAASVLLWEDVVDCMVARFSKGMAQLWRNLESGAFLDKYVVSTYPTKRVTNDYI
jgi:hypothetical protein